MSLQDPSHNLLPPQPETHADKPPVSERRILANCRNALRSTGPKTMRGKRTVSRNAITHGILAREVVITAGDGEESQEEFDALIEDLENCYQPVGAVEELHLQKIATALWRKARVLRAENGEIRRQLDTAAAERMLRSSDKSNFDLALQEMGWRLHNPESPTDQKASTMDRWSASRPEQFAGTSIRPRIPNCTSEGCEIRDPKRRLHITRASKEDLLYGLPLGLRPGAHLRKRWPWASRNERPNLYNRNVKRGCRRHS
jgi:hypothetical protein